MIGKVDERVVIADGAARLEGRLSAPADVHGLVVFAHGSGSGRGSPRNQRVAGSLEREGLATFLFDLLTPDEQASMPARFDIALLARRLLLAVVVLRRHRELASLPLGLFGASTGAAAALHVAADSETNVAAVVSRGGRPDLAEAALDRVRAATLLIVGGRDETVLELNRRCVPLLAGPAELAVVPGATHLFEEPGALDAVAQLAARWFGQHLVAAPPG